MTRTPAHPRQQGFAAIAAVFLIVVLAALGGFIAMFSNAQQLSAAQDLQGARAYWAARSGLAWGLTQVNSASPVCVASSALAIGGFTVTVTCAKNSYTEGGAAVNIYQVQSLAQTSTAPSAVGGLGYVERSLSASMEK